MRVVIWILALSLMGCSKEESTPMLEVSETQMSWNINQEAALLSVQVISSGVWTAEVSPDAASWMIVSPLKGSAGTSTVNVEVKENTDSEARKGTLTIQSEGLVKTVTVTQEGFVPTLMLSQEEYVVSSEGERIQVSLMANIDYVVEISAPDWIREIETRTLSSGVHSFDIGKNEDYEARTGEIRFVNETYGVMAAARITQQQKDVLEVAQDRYEMPAEGGRLELAFCTNVEVEVEMSVDWISQVRTRGPENRTLQFNVAENLQKQERTAVITLSGNGLSQQVTVIQSGAFLPEGGGVDDMPVEEW